MSININFETKNIIRFFIVASIFVAAIFGLYRMYGALMLIAVSFFLALALNPAVDLLSKYMPRKKRGPAIAIVFIFVVGLLLFLFASIIPPVVKETSNFVEDLPKTVQSVTSENSRARNFVRKYHLEGTIETGTNALKTEAQKLGSGTISSVGTLTTSLINTVTVVVMTVLMLTGGKNLLDTIVNVLYKDKTTRKHHVELAKKMYRTVTGYALGQVSVALVGSTCALLAMLLLKVPYALPLALIVFVFALIPLVGTTLGAIAVSLLALILKDPTTALIMIVYFIVYQQIENATLQPAVQSRTSELPPLVIFTSVILGIGLIGPVGGIFAIPVAGCIKILLADYLQRREEGVIEDEPKGFVAKLKKQVKEVI